MCKLQNDKNLWGDKDTCGAKPGLPCDGLITLIQSFLIKKRNGEVNEFQTIDCRLILWSSFLTTYTPQKKGLLPSNRQSKNKLQCQVAEKQRWGQDTECVPVHAAVLVFCFVCILGNVIAFSSENEIL
jgi:hypothetical protein